MTLGGRDITKLPTHGIARAGIAHVPQGRGTFSELTVDDNLRIPALAAHLKPADTAGRILDLGYALQILPHALVSVRPTVF